VPVLIVLLSGNGKYLLEGDDVEAVLEAGRNLYSLVRDDRGYEFHKTLSELHDFVKTKGTPVEIFRPVDFIIPPPDCDPQIIRQAFGLQKTP
jgi:hypothetical protein